MEMELRPDDPETYYNRGKVYGDKGEYRKAIQDFGKALKLNPKFYRGVCQTRLGLLPRK